MASLIGVTRLLSFVDGVFAIAITLLALDIGVPDGLTAAELPGALRDEGYAIGAYVLSFAVIGTLWLAHHRLFNLVVRVDGWLVRLDLTLLAVIAALPFPTRLISEYGDAAVSVAVYAGSIAAAGGLMAAMAVRIGRRPGLRDPGLPPEAVRAAIAAASTVTAVFATSIPITLLSPVAAQLWWLLIFPARLVLRARRGPR